MASNAIGNMRFEDVRGRHVLAALSGGADSVALLVLLSRRRKADALTLTAAHFHHGIRGAQADADAAFCRSLCARLEIPFIEGHADVPAEARRLGVGIETAARDLRHAFLQNARAGCGADVIALAHHLNDQAETILMHLLRGAGPDGAAGMMRISGVLYRPLLDVPKAALVQFLEEEGISWREDATNALPDNPRNALRLNVLPEIEKSYPSAAEAIARFGRLSRIESEYMARQTQAFLSERLENGPYGRRLRLDGTEDEAILRRALRKLSGSLNAQSIDSLFQIARQQRGKMEISSGMYAEKTPSALYFLPKTALHAPETVLQIPGETVLKGICRIRAELGNFPMEPEDSSTELFDADALEGAVVRLRRNADRIRPLGAPGDKLLSDYLTDRKIDRPLRETLPLVAAGNRILWACGVGMAHEARIQPDTQRTVRLKIHFITDEEPEVLS